MVEYVFDTTFGTFSLFTDQDSFYEFYEKNPELGKIYEEGFDYIVVYLKERDDTLAKSIMEPYFIDFINKVKEAEIEVGEDITEYIEEE